MRFPDKKKTLDDALANASSEKERDSLRAAYQVLSSPTAVSPVNASVYLARMEY